MLSSFMPSVTLSAVVADIPHDAGALVMYGVLALFIAFVWIGNRRSGGGSRRDGAAPPAGAGDSPAQHPSRTSAKRRRP